MEAAMRQRKSLGMAFTKTYNSFSAKLKGTCSRDDNMVAFQLLQTKTKELEAVYAICNKFLFESEATEDEIAKELEDVDEYTVAFLNAKMMADDLQEVRTENIQSVLSDNLPGATKGSLKLPQIELPKFKCHVKEWLLFWSIFKKIHEDNSIRREDKFQYLIQATSPDSRARELVRSFPPTADNYDKAIASLKSRFGQDDIVVKYYVRELLGLVLQNELKGGPKATLSANYDKLEAYIRALDTLRVTTEKCASMLYPLVESALPKEILRAWQRNGQYRTIENEGHNMTRDKLTKL
ncbi:uncharacterized protein LOC127280286 [Leptopilina boulardi]|uniref:uncharacterized protein LOC127280286 n=1 Tax=Leptopilina boulardi TaxID=63433 RepID=UPI0021F5F704|nr:uncharacterized protein LOC127280286 [Leptopilina boulardi]